MIAKAVLAPRTVLVPVTVLQRVPGRAPTTADVVIGNQIMTLTLPLHYCGGDLGLGFEVAPTIEIEDRSGQRFETSSVEFLLRNLELFPRGPVRQRILGDAAVHYGMNPWALVSGRCTEIGGAA